MVLFFCKKEEMTYALLSDMKIPKAIFVRKLVWLNRRVAEGRKEKGSVEGRKKGENRRACHSHCS